MSLLLALFACIILVSHFRWRFSTLYHGEEISATMEINITVIAQQLLIGVKIFLYNLILHVSMDAVAILRQCHIYVPASVNRKTGHSGNERGGITSLLQGQ